MSDTGQRAAGPSATSVASAGTALASDHGRDADAALLAWADSGKAKLVSPPQPHLSPPKDTAAPGGARGSYASGTAGAASMASLPNALEPPSTTPATPAFAVKHTSAAAPPPTTGLGRFEQIMSEYRSVRETMRPSPGTADASAGVPAATAAPPARPAVSSGGGSVTAPPTMTVTAITSTAAPSSYIDIQSTHAYAYTQAGRRGRAALPRADSLVSGYTASTASVPALTETLTPAAVAAQHQQQQLPLSMQHPRAPPPPPLQHPSSYAGGVQPHPSQGVSGTYPGVLHPRPHPPGTSGDVPLWPTAGSVAAAGTPQQPPAVASVAVHHAAAAYATVGHTAAVGSPPPTAGVVLYPHPHPHPSQPSLVSSPHAHAHAHAGLTVAAIPSAAPPAPPPTSPVLPGQIELRAAAPKDVGAYRGGLMSASTPTSAPGYQPQPSSQYPPVPARHVSFHEEVVTISADSSAAAVAAGGVGDAVLVASSGTPVPALDDAAAAAAIAQGVALPLDAALPSDIAASGVHVAVGERVPTSGIVVEGTVADALVEAEAAAAVLAAAAVVDTEAAAANAAAAAAAAAASAITPALRTLHEQMEEHSTRLAMQAEQAMAAVAAVANAVAGVVPAVASGPPASPAPSPLAIANVPAPPVGMVAAPAATAAMPLVSPPRTRGVALDPILADAADAAAAAAAVAAAAVPLDHPLPASAAVFDADPNPAGLPQPQRPLTSPVRMRRGPVDGAAAAFADPGELGPGPHAAVSPTAATVAVAVEEAKRAAVMSMKEELAAAAAAAVAAAIASPPAAPVTEHVGGVTITPVAHAAAPLPPPLPTAGDLAPVDPAAHPPAVPAAAAVDVTCATASPVLVTVPGAVDPHHALLVGGGVAQVPLSGAVDGLPVPSGPVHVAPGVEAYGQPVPSTWLPAGKHLSEFPPPRTLEAAVPVVPAGSAAAGYVDASTHISGSDAAAAAAIAVPSAVVPPPSSSYVDLAGVPLPSLAPANAGLEGTVAAPSSARGLFSRGSPSPSPPRGLEVYQPPPHHPPHSVAAAPGTPGTVALIKQMPHPQLSEYMSPSHTLPSKPAGVAPSALAAAPGSVVATMVAQPQPQPQPSMPPSQSQAIGFPTMSALLSTTTATATTPSVASAQFHPHAGAPPATPMTPGMPQRAGATYASSVHMQGTPLPLTVATGSGPPSASTTGVPVPQAAVPRVHYLHFHDGGAGVSAATASSAASHVHPSPKGILSEGAIMPQALTAVVSPGFAAAQAPPTTPMSPAAMMAASASTWQHGQQPLQPQEAATVQRLSEAYDRALNATGHQATPRGLVRTQTQGTQGSYVLPSDSSVMSLSEDGSSPTQQPASVYRRIQTPPRGGGGGRKQPQQQQQSRPNRGLPSTQTLVDDDAAASVGSTHHSQLSPKRSTRRSGVSELSDSDFPGPDPHSPSPMDVSAAAPIPDGRVDPPPSKPQARRRPSSVGSAGLTRRRSAYVLGPALGGGGSAGEDNDTAGRAAYDSDVDVVTGAEAAAVETRRISPPRRAAATRAGGSAHDDAGGGGGGEESPRISPVRAATTKGPAAVAVVGEDRCTSPTRAAAAPGTPRLRRASHAAAAALATEMLAAAAAAPLPMPPLPLLPDIPPAPRPVLIAVAGGGGGGDVVRASSLSYDPELELALSASPASVLDAAAATAALHASAIPPVVLPPVPLPLPLPLLLPSGDGLDVSLAPGMPVSSSVVQFDDFSKAHTSPLRSVPMSASVSVLPDGPRSRSPSTTTAAAAYTSTGATVVHKVPAMPLSTHDGFAGGSTPRRRPLASPSIASNPTQRGPTTWTSVAESVARGKSLSAYESEVAKPRESWQKSTVSDLGGGVPPVASPASAFASAAAPFSTEEEGEGGTAGVVGPSSLAGRRPSATGRRKSVVQFAEPQVASAHATGDVVKSPPAKGGADVTEPSPSGGAAALSPFHTFTAPAPAPTPMHTGVSGTFHAVAGVDWAQEDGSSRRISIKGASKDTAPSAVAAAPGASAFNSVRALPLGSRSGSREEAPVLHGCDATAVDGAFASIPETHSLHEEHGSFAALPKALDVTLSPVQMLPAPAAPDSLLGSESESTTLAPERLSQTLAGYASRDSTAASGGAALPSEGAGSHTQPLVAGTASGAGASVSGSVSRWRSGGGHNIIDDPPSERLVAYASKAEASNPDPHPQRLSQTLAGYASSTPSQDATLHASPVGRNELAGYASDSGSQARPTPRAAAGSPMLVAYASAGASQAGDIGALREPMSHTLAGYASDTPSSQVRVVSGSYDGDGDGRSRRISEGDAGAVPVREEVRGNPFSPCHDRYRSEVPLPVKCRSPPPFETYQRPLSGLGGGRARGSKTMAPRPPTGSSPRRGRSGSSQRRRRSASPPVVGSERFLSHTLSSAGRARDSSKSPPSPKAARRGLGSPAHAADSAPPPTMPSSVVKAHPPRAPAAWWQLRQATPSPAPPVDVARRLATESPLRGGQSAAVSPVLPPAAAVSAPIGETARYALRAISPMVALDTPAARPRAPTSTYVSEMGSAASAADAARTESPTRIGRRARGVVGDVVSLHTGSRHFAPGGGGDAAPPQPQASTWWRAADGPATAAVSPPPPPAAAAGGVVNVNINVGAGVGLGVGDLAPVRGASPARSVSVNLPPPPPQSPWDSPVRQPTTATPPLEVGAAAAAAVRESATWAPSLPKPHAAHTISSHLHARHLAGAQPSSRYEQFATHRRARMSP